MMDKFMQSVEMFDQLKREIMSYETPTTYEIVGVTFGIPMLSEELFAMLGVDVNKMYDVIDHADKGISKVIGAYDTSHYIDMIKQFRHIAYRLLNNITDVWSRQMVIVFPVLHCFETIQFIIRDGAIVVLCNMRSCNFEVNLLSDMFLAYHLGGALATNIRNEKLCTCNRVDVIMHIGSLHIFKKEVQ